MELFSSYQKLLKCDGISFEGGVFRPLYQLQGFHFIPNHIRGNVKSTAGHKNAIGKIDLQRHDRKQNTAKYLQGNGHAFLLGDRKSKTTVIRFIFETCCEQPWVIFYQTSLTST